MSYVDVFNGFEAVLWASLAVWNLMRTTQQPRQQVWLISGTLVLFAISELIELKTGAWWKPWWLAILKGVCIAVLISILIVAARKKTFEE